MSARRIDLIRAALAQLAPVELDIEDQSHLHRGHPGARDGRGHFAVRIVADRFSGCNPIQRHRLVYEALGDLMQTDIHALTIAAHAPEELDTP